MKKMAILLILILLLGAGGGAGWWFFLREQPEQVAEVQQEQSLVPMTRFIDVDPLTLPVIREGQVMLHVTMILAIELVEAIELESVDTYGPQLRDRMLSALHSVFALRYVQDRGYDHPIVRQRLTVAAEAVLGKGAVRGVLIRNMSKRNPRTG